jgi:hypothetical protein
MRSRPGLGLWSCLSLSIVPVLALSQGCNPVMEDEAPTGEAEQPLAAPGFAELHHHMFAEEAFCGGWFHGNHTGTLASCDGGMP